MRSSAVPNRCPRDSRRGKGLGRGVSNLPAWMTRAKQEDELEKFTPEGAGDKHQEHGPAKWAHHGKASWNIPHEYMNARDEGPNQDRLSGPTVEPQGFTAVGTKLKQDDCDNRRIPTIPMAKYGRPKIPAIKTDANVRHAIASDASSRNDSRSPRQLQKHDRHYNEITPTNSVQMQHFSRSSAQRASSEGFPQREMMPSRGDGQRHIERSASSCSSPREQCYSQEKRNENPSTVTNSGHQVAKDENYGDRETLDSPRVVPHKVVKFPPGCKVCEFRDDGTTCEENPANIGQIISVADSQHSGDDFCYNVAEDEDSSKIIRVPQSALSYAPGCPVLVGKPGMSHGDPDWKMGRVTACFDRRFVKGEKYADIPCVVYSVWMEREQVGLFVTEDAIKYRSRAQEKTPKTEEQQVVKSSVEPNQKAIKGKAPSQKKLKEESNGTVHEKPNRSRHQNGTPTKKSKKLPSGADSFSPGEIKEESSDRARQLEPEEARHENENKPGRRDLKAEIVAHVLSSKRSSKETTKGGRREGQQECKKSSKVLATDAPDSDVTRRSSSGGETKRKRNDLMKEACTTKDKNLRKKQLLLRPKAEPC